MSETRSSKSLDVNVLNSPRRSAVGERPLAMGPPFGWDPTTATLVYGERDAVLVDALTTTAEAEALAGWIALHDRILTTIYITHGHPDHFFGLSVLLERFPGARAIATSGTMEVIAQTPPELIELGWRMWPGLPAEMTLPEPYESGTFTLEGEEIRIIEQGRTDGLHSTSLHVPCIDLVVAGDVLYNQCHMFVGDTTPASRENWIAALDRLAALNPKIAVAGHKKTGAPDTPGCIEDSKRYLRDFGRLQESGLSERELFDGQALSALGQPPVLADVRAAPQDGPGRGQMMLADRSLVPGTWSRSRPSMPSGRAPSIPSARMPPASSCTPPMATCRPRSCARAAVTTISSTATAATWNGQRPPRPGTWPTAARTRWRRRPRRCTTSSRCRCFRPGWAASRSATQSSTAIS